LLPKVCLKCEENLLSHEICLGEKNRKCLVKLIHNSKFQVRNGAESFDENYANVSILRISQMLIYVVFVKLLLKWTFSVNETQEVKTLLKQRKNQDCKHIQNYISAIRTGKPLRKQL